MPMNYALVRATDGGTMRSLRYWRGAVGRHHNGTGGISLTARCGGGMTTLKTVCDSGNRVFEVITALFSIEGDLKARD